MEHGLPQLHQPALPYPGVLWLPRQLQRWVTRARVNGPRQDLFQRIERVPPGENDKCIGRKTNPVLQP